MKVRKKQEIPLYASGISGKDEALALVSGQSEREVRPTFPGVVSEEFAVLSAGEIASDRQAQARTSALSGAGFLGAVEAVEDVWQVFRGDPGPGVRNARLRPITEEAP